MGHRRVADRIASAPTCRCRLDNIPGTSDGAARSISPHRWAAGGAEGIRASSPAGETWMSEPVGADLPEARDGEGQLSKDALRSPELQAGNAPKCHRTRLPATAQMLRRYAVANALFAFTRARATGGHPCLTALRRPWLRADRRRLALTSMSRQPATTLGCPPLPRSGGRDGCTSVVEAERSRTAQRGFADPRVDRDVAARLSEGPVPAAQRCGEIERAAPSEVPGVLSRRHRHAGAEAMRPATRRNVSNQADSYRANAPALRCR